MGAEPAGRPLPESVRNPSLRAVDWRFLLPGPDPPQIELTGFPSGRALGRARRALRPGGWVVCGWRVPRPGGLRRAERRLRAAGLVEVSVYWAGPLPHRTPQFWLPLRHEGAVEQLLAGRPPRSRGQALLRALWRRLARRGLLAPLFVIARMPGPDDRGPGDPLTALGPVSLTLLTGGRRSINKVVGLAFPPGAGEPAAVAKFARVPEAEGGLEREAEALRVLERERPSLAGVPRLLGEGRRAGALGIVETPLPGRPLLEALAPATFPELAGRVTDHLIELAGTPPRSPRSGWEEALVERPLAELERGFSGVIEASELEAVRAALARLDRLPLVFEHRDCSPWNVILADSGGLGLLDWESSQPRGLPALDLVYFLANAVFVLEGALESGRTREEYSRLLDPGSAHGRVFADCCARYAAALSLDDETLAALRLLCWVVHCASDRRHAELEIAGVPDPDELRRSPFLGLLREELAQRG